ncbi:MAG: sialate O-acetylesterase [Bacteroidota bacterium]
MKNQVFAFLLMCFFVTGAFAIDQFPKDKQLYPRNVKTNLASIPVSGELSAGSEFKTVRIKLLREGKLVKSTDQNVKFAKGSGSYHFDLSIPAELANYSVELYGVTKTGESLIRKASEVVAGDVYLINGQSNSVANSYRGSTQHLKNRFVRSFGTTMHDTTAGANLNWYEAEGDSVAYPGTIGQWGLKTANAIVNSQKIPVAVIAGGVGGTHLLQHMRNDSIPQDLKTIYGRLLYRVSNAGVQQSIRAIWWHQGETDGYYRRTPEQYKELWNRLKSQWAIDYPSTGHFFTFQIRQGCGDWQNFALNIMEAQRQLALESPNLSVVSTNGVDQNIDYCHFPFTKGYEMFADRLIPLVLKKMYGSVTPADPRSPDIASAKMTDAVTVELTFNHTETLTFEPGVQFDFKIEDSEIAVIDGTASGNKVTLKLSEAPSTPVFISYTGHPGQGSPYLRSGTVNGALSFQRFSVQGR